MYYVFFCKNRNKIFKSAICYIIYINKYNTYRLLFFKNHIQEWINKVNECRKRRMIQKQHFFTIFKVYNLNFRGIKLHKTLIIIKIIKVKFFFFCNYVFINRIECV